MARGIREISVGVFQFDMGNIGRKILENQSFWNTFMKRYEADVAYVNSKS